MTHPHQRDVAVFEAALQLPPEQREAYRDQTCGDHLEWRDRIRGLLRPIKIRSLSQKRGSNCLTEWKQT